MVWNNAIVGHLCRGHSDRHVALHTKEQHAKRVILRQIVHGILDRSLTVQSLLNLPRGNVHAAVADGAIKGIQKSHLKNTEHQHGKAGKHRQADQQHSLNAEPAAATVATGGTASVILFFHHTPSKR